MNIATQFSENLTAYALVISAVGGSITAIVATVYNGKKIQSVDRKVETVNGRSIGILAELAEGRRIRNDIPEMEWTVRERAYVNLLEQVEREGSAHEAAEDVKLVELGEPRQGPGRPLSGGQTYQD